MTSPKEATAQARSVCEELSVAAAQLASACAEGDYLDEMSKTQAKTAVDTSNALAKSCATVVLLFDEFVEGDDESYVTTLDAAAAMLQSHVMKDCIAAIAVCDEAEEAEISEFRKQCDKISGLCFQAHNVIRSCMEEIEKGPLAGKDAWPGPVQSPWYKGMGHDHRPPEAPEVKVRRLLTDILNVRRGTPFGDSKVLGRLDVFGAQVLKERSGETVLAEVPPALLSPDTVTGTAAVGYTVLIGTVAPFNKDLKEISSVCPTAVNDAALDARKRVLEDQYRNLLKEFSKGQGCEYVLCEQLCESLCKGLSGLGRELCLDGCASETCEDEAQAARLERLKLYVEQACNALDRMQQLETSKLFVLTRSKPRLEALITELCEVIQQATSALISERLAGTVQSPIVTAGDLPLDRLLSMSETYVCEKWRGWVDVCSKHTVAAISEPAAQLHAEFMQVCSSRALRNCPEVRRCCMRICDLLERVAALAAEVAECIDDNVGSSHNQDTEQQLI